MLAATCATVTGASNWRCEPSGSRTETILLSMPAKPSPNLIAILACALHPKSDWAASTCIALKEGSATKKTDEKKRGLAALFQFCKDEKETNKKHNQTNFSVVRGVITGSPFSLLQRCLLQNVGRHDWTRTNDPYH